MIKISKRKPAWTWARQLVDKRQTAGCWSSSGASLQPVLQDCQAEFRCHSAGGTESVCCVKRTTHMIHAGPEAPNYIYSNSCHPIFFFFNRWSTLSGCSIAQLFTFSTFQLLNMLYLSVVVLFVFLLLLSFILLIHFFILFFFATNKFPTNFPVMRWIKDALSHFWNHN